jgi:hypothetical protein
MISVILILVFSGLSYFGYANGWTANNGNWLPILFTVISATYFIIWICCEIAIYYKQIYDFETIKNIKNRKKIYENKMNDVLPQLKMYLGKNYAEYEKDIYKSINSKDYAIFLANYPKLQNIKAVQGLIENINKYYNHIYSCDLDVEDKLRDIRVRQQNPFIIINHYKEI